MKRIRDDAGRLGVALSSSQAGVLQRYTELLEERAAPLGLVAASDRGRMYQRHVLDSLRAAAEVRDDDGLAYDLGSGAGLPGIVVAVATPRCRFVLAESRARRAAFLELVVERLALENVEVAVARAETLRGAADLATARAFAPLERSWEVAHPLLRPGGRLVYFAGEGLRDPRGAAARLRSPSPPEEVKVSRGLATGRPLVIIARG